MRSGSMATRVGKAVSASLTKVGLALAAAGSAQAAPTLLLQGTELTGARNVLVSGQYYDVDFLDGSCNGVFGGCNPARFVFTNAGQATAATQALLDQVFLDGPPGKFDSNPELIFGCSDTLFCRADTPYRTTGQAPDTFVIVESALNFSTGSAEPDGIGVGNVALADFDYGREVGRVWASWSRAASPPNAVPEPGSLGISALALAALLALRRRQA